MGDRHEPNGSRDDERFHPPQKNSAEGILPTVIKVVRGC